MSSRFYKTISPSPKYESKKNPALLARSVDYSGDTIISNGTFRAGANSVIPNGTGKGNVTLEGKLDLAGFNVAMNGLNGNTGTIDNTAGGLAAPAVLTVGNGGASGVFAGQISNSVGSLQLNKSGGSLVLLANNGYSGGTISGSGLLQLGLESSIGTGPLTLNGGTLAWMDSAPHTLTNFLTLGGSVTFGGTTNGPLLVISTVNFNGGGRGLTCNTDVLFSNGMSNGAVTGKSGPGTLTLRNTSADWANGSLGINNGTFSLENSSIIQDGNNIRIQCTTAGGTARLLINQGASLTLSNSPTGNFRFGDSATAGVDATNILDLAGTLTILPYPSTSDKFQMGSSTDPSGQNIVNLLPGGVLRTRQVLDQAGSSLSSFNFNGGILSPNTNDFASNFILGLDALNVLDGGAIIDTAGWDISIGLAFTGVGHGGLTKQGAGKLTLNPLGFYSSYTGDTLIKAGTLALANSENLAGSTNIMVAAGATLDLASTGTFFSMVPGQILSGNGNVSGNVFLDPAAIIAPGSPFGALTFDLPPSLTGIVVMHVSKTGSVITNSVLVLTGSNTLDFGGKLVVVNVGAPLASGDTIKLFDAANYANAFATMTLPALVHGLSWDTSALSLNGTLKVIGTAIQPKFNPAIVRNGANQLLSGSGGTAGGTYYVVSSPSLSLPLSSWTRVATNVFDASGNFTFTNLMNTSVPARFFNLQLP